MLDVRRSHFEILYSVTAAAVLLCSCVDPASRSGAETGFPRLSGPYLGQSPPGAEPTPFAPGVVSTGMYTRDIAITPDGKEIYFGVVVGSYDLATIAVTREVDGVWTEPEIAPFATDSRYWHIEPAISPDGQRFFFVSNRPIAGDGPALEQQDIWVMDRDDDGWSEPYNLGAPVNTELGEFFPSITDDGTLYFTREDRAKGEDLIVRSRLVDGAYSEPEVLPAEVNSGTAQFNAFIAPDESYIIVPTAGREDSVGSIDYYISFRDDEDIWQGPFNLGKKINTSGHLEYSPYVSRDGHFFFFMAMRQPQSTLNPDGKLTFRDMLNASRAPGSSTPTIWWVDAGFLAGLEP